MTTIDEQYNKMWQAIDNTTLENLFRIMGYGLTEAMSVGILLQKIKEHPEIKEAYKAKTRYHINNVVRTEANVLDKIKFMFASKVTRSYLLTCFEIACEKNFKAGFYMNNKEEQNKFTILKWEAKQNIIDIYKEIKGMKENETL